MNLPVGAVHHVPGRIRIRLPFLKKDPEALAEVRTFLAGLDGVSSAQENVLTGSILLHYDRNAHADFYDRMMRTVKENFGLLESALPGLIGGVALDSLDLAAFDPDVPSEASVLLADAFENLDRRVRIATDNSFDLRSLLPITVLGAAVLRLGVAAATPLWITLAIFSFSSFAAMHPHVVAQNGHRKTVREPEGEARGQRARARRTKT